jgi:hypothetical protein
MEEPFGLFQNKEQKHNLTFYYLLGRSLKGSPEREQKLNQKSVNILSNFLLPIGGGISSRDLPNGNKRLITIYCSLY